ncbi:hypothetical protein F5884DRAFT_879741 [Xylogone sp. PMI_703]|nr:hypothetical protein F5884DRAFT_879741 [Xylogone sp. PMI_703]
MNPASLIFYLLTHIVLIQVVRSSRFCEERSNLCINFTLAQNVSTGYTDFYISISYKFGHDGGWAALGTGNVMAGSLMFIVYPDEQKKISLSVRAASGHAQPESNSDVPEVCVLNSSLTALGESSVAFVCYACDHWPGVNAMSQAQSFIWAKRDHRIIPGISTEVMLGIHTEAGSFQLDLAQSYLDINQQHQSYIDANDQWMADTAMKTSAATETSTIKTSMRALHGLTLGFSFMILFPVGTVLIRANLKQSFVYHWIWQSFLAAICLATVILGIAFSQKSTDFRNFRDPHQILGLTILSCLLLQIIMGYRHHTNYKELKRRTLVSYGHIWVGWTILILGVVNTRVGLAYSVVDRKWVMLWGLVLMVDMVALLFYICYKLQEYRRSRTVSYMLLNN